MPTSGVPKRARSVARRRSQLAANSSAPPMQTPSMAASTGIGAASVTRVTRWKARDRRRPRLGRGLDRGEQVVAGGEVLAGAARDDAAHRLVGARGLDGVGDRLDGLARPRVAVGLAVPRHHPRRSQLASPSRSCQHQLLSSRRAVHDACLLLAHRQRAGRHRLYLEARAELRAQRRVHALDPVRASRRRPAAAGRSDRPRPPPRSGPAPRSARAPRRSRPGAR